MEKLIEKTSRRDGTIEIVIKQTVVRISIWWLVVIAILALAIDLIVAFSIG